MANTLNDIADRLTPSVPTEITFAGQPIATGRKITTLFGHMAAAGFTALPYAYHDMVNVGDPAAALAEVDALAGSGSQIGKMAKAFVDANASISSPRNFPAFRVVFLPNAELHFGPSDEAITAVKTLRSDLFVSCYPASDATNKATLLALVQLVSGIDRNLQGQFGSFMILGDIDSLATQVALAINNAQVIVASLPDTNTAAVVGVTADVTNGSNILTNVSNVSGIYKGAQISSPGIPADTVVEAIGATSITISNAATATHAAGALTIQNVVSQPAEIVAAAHAAAMMSIQFPYPPAQGLVIGGLVPPQKSSDLIEINPNGTSEQALIAGLSPLYVQPGGTVGFIRTRTTLNLKPDNVTPITDYFDWQMLVILYDFREVIYQISQNPPFNNNPGGSKLTEQLAAKFKDEVLRNAYAFETLGGFENVKLLSKFFIVQRSTTSRGRLDFKVPEQVVPGLYVIAGNIQAVSDATNFSL